MTKDRPRDVNQLAARIVAEAVGDEPRTEPPAMPEAPADESALRWASDADKS